VAAAVHEPLGLANLAPFHVTSLGFLWRAKDFLEASVLLSEKSGRFSFVPAFLACRAVELCLKSYLLLNGDDITQVKAHGHDLVATLAVCKTRGIDAVVELDPDEVALLKRSTDYYRGQEFAYFDIVSSISLPRDPDLAMLAPIAAKLLKAIEERYDGPNSAS
jgi:HEPN domain-containing protein